MPEDKLSFIPQKKFGPTAYKEAGPGLVTIFSLLLFFISAGSWGGLFLYKKSLQKDVNDLAQSLERARAAFEISLINEMNQVSGKINYSKKLLDRHTSLTPVFDFLERNTLKNLRFKDFKYSIDKDGKPTVLLEGLAESYSGLALQGNIFEKDKNVKGVSFSGIGLGEKGVINFAVKLLFDPSMIIYKAEKEK